jgi:RimJ/RimL family protein N-acetyltransferase
VIIPTLETERLRLREWRDGDIVNFAKFKMDKHAAHFVSPMETLHDSWREMAYCAGHWLLRGFGKWSLERKDTGAHIGYCGPYFPKEWPEPEIGWGIYPEHQHQGFATEAAVASLTYAYDVLKWPTAISLIANENAPSAAVAKRLGANAEAPIHFRCTDCTIYRHLSPTELQQHLKENMKCH